MALHKMCSWVQGGGDTHNADSAKSTTFKLLSMRSNNDRGRLQRSRVTDCFWSSSISLTEIWSIPLCSIET